VNSLDGPSRDGQDCWRGAGYRRAGCDARALAGGRPTGGELVVDAPFATLACDLQAACDSQDYRSYLRHLEKAYVRVPPAERDALRCFLQSDSQLREGFVEQMRRVSEQAESAGDYTAALRARLLLVSVDDSCGSALVYWEWIDAVSRGVDPAPHFEEMAALSSTQPHWALGISMQTAMRQVAADLGRFWPPDVARLPDLIAALGSRVCFQHYWLARQPLRYPVEGAAAVAVCLLGPKARDAAPALCELLHAGIGDESFLHDLASLVQTAIVRIGPGAVPALRPLLADPDASARLAALSTLGKMGAGASAVVTEIEGMVEDPDQLVCCQALGTLAAIGPEARAALPAIRRASQDEDYLIRLNARRALRKLDPDSMGVTLP
jgi:hypothetical protein